MSTRVCCSIKLTDGPLKELVESIRGLGPEEAGKILLERQDIAEAHEKVAEEGQTKVGVHNSE